jgi:hypothetical protein
MMGSFRGVKHMIPAKRSGFANCAGFLNAAAPTSKCRAPAQSGVASQ